MKTTDPLILVWFGKYVFKLFKIRTEHIIWCYIDETRILGWTVGIRLFGQYHKISMIISCTVRVIYSDDRDSPITVLLCMYITQETFIDSVTSWYDHYCADANILILSYLPCWCYVFSTIAFIMWKSFVCKFVLPMLNVFILVHKWKIHMDGCYMPYILLYFMLYMHFFTMYFVRNDKINLWNQWLCPKISCKSRWNTCVKCATVST